MNILVWLFHQTFHCRSGRLNSLYLFQVEPAVLHSIHVELNGIGARETEGDERGRERVKMR